MKKNLGQTDKIIRIILAVVAVVLFATNTVSGTLGIVLIGVAGILVATSFINFCPLYAVFGLSTKKK